MVQGHPYYGLGGRREGRVGPASKMTTTLAAYAPNIPWPRIGCSNAVNAGGDATSAATPQSAVGRQLRRTAKGDPNPLCRGCLWLAKAALPM